MKGRIGRQAGLEQASDATVTLSDCFKKNGTLRRRLEGRAAKRSIKYFKEADDISCNYYALLSCLPSWNEAFSEY